MAELRFPLFFDLTGRPVKVFGGGAIALRRVTVLLRFDACVTVVSPEFLPELEALSAEYPAKLQLRRGCYAPGDMIGAFFVLACTGDNEVNHRIAEEARERHIFVNNAADQRDNDFSFPAIATKEGISVGICGTGRDHTAVRRTAKQIRSIISEGETP